MGSRVLSPYKDVPLAAGVMRQRLAMQAPTAGVDAFNQPVPAWNTVMTMWGHVEEMLGQERFAAEQYVGKKLARIRTRYAPSLQPTAGWRIVNSRSGTVYEILAVIDPGHTHKQFDFLVSAVQP